jgi:predicted RNase H-like nuclease
MRIEDLERELRAERPEPDPEFARRLDEWAAAGFPRDRGLGPRTGRPGPAGGLRRAWERLTSVPRLRVLAPAGSVAVMLVVIGVAISQSGELGSDDEALSGQAGGDAATSAPRSEDSFEFGAGGSAESGDFAAREGERLAAPPEETLVPAPIPDGGGGIARGTEERIVDATARLTLGAEAGEVQEVANRVVEVTDRHDGIVLDSQVTSDQGGARAAFELEIPFRELDAALTDLSELGDVISRTEGEEDITVRAVRAQRELAGVLERIREARVELIRADTREERLIIKSRIRSLEATADALEAERNQVERQGRFATVAVEVTSNGPDSEGGWSLGDALDDAGRVLEVIGGIVLVSLAVLVPLALVIALAWLIATRTQRHRRERALGS